MATSYAKFDQFLRKRNINDPYSECAFSKPKEILEEIETNEEDF